MVVVQGDGLNHSRIDTVICIPLTTNLYWADARGNVLLPGEVTGLSKPSVALVPQIIAVEKDLLRDRAGTISRGALGLLFSRLDQVLGR